MKDLNKDKLSITVEQNNISYKLNWSGICNFEKPKEILDPYFEELLNEIDKSNELILDFANLKLLNSSSIFPLLSLIKNLNKNDIKSTIIYNKNSRWQLVSFKAIKKIISTMKNIEVIEIEL